MQPIVWFVVNDLRIKASACLFHSCTIMLLVLVGFGCILHHYSLSPIFHSAWIHSVLIVTQKTRACELCPMHMKVRFCPKGGGIIRHLKVTGHLFIWRRALSSPEGTMSSQAAELRDCHGIHDIIYVLAGH